MFKKQSILNVAVRATGALFSSLNVVIPLAVLFGTTVALLDVAVMELVAPEASKGGASDQSTMIKLMFGWWGVMLFIEVTLGPILAAMAIYAARTHSHGGELSFSKALNFALSRYGKIFKWHAIAMLTIQVGMIAIVPGVLFLLQYAFVDSILCLEDEKWPLGRSAHLTKGRRGRIFGLVFVWLMFTQIVGFAELWALGMGTHVLIALMSLAYLLNIWVVMVFYTFYEDRTQKAA
jgi:low affinity Fe/Cu permease